MRPLAALIDQQDPALPLIVERVSAAAHGAEILAPSPARGEVLQWLQVSTRSHLGAVAYETGGILVDHGWLHILGSGNDKLSRNLRDWNTGRSSGYTLVADDAVGGFFALNGGSLGEQAGAMYYWAPDTLAWEALGLGYGNFLEWTLSPALAQFYHGLRWPGWEADIACLNADQCLSFYPFLWSEHGSVQDRTRGIAGMGERLQFNHDLAQQLRGE